MTNNQMYIQRQVRVSPRVQSYTVSLFDYVIKTVSLSQRQVLAPAPVIQNIESRLHTCNAHHQPSVRPANIAYLQGEENQPHTSRTES